MMMINASSRCIQHRGAPLLDPIGRHYLATRHHTRRLVTYFQPMISYTFYLMIDWWSLLLADFDLQEEHMIVMWCSILFVPFLLPHEIGILPALSVSWLRRSTIRLKSTGLLWLGLFWLGLNHRNL